jgi:phospholipid/cholesterol/gamma-HCH transport system substrate-binding protein
VRGGRELVVGLVIVAGLAVAIVGSLWLSGSGFGRESIPLDVVVLDIGQLREGNSVKYRGVPIGRVREFDVVEGGDAVRVRLLLDRTLDLPDDAVALVAPESLFGEWQVELVSRSRFPAFDYLDVDESHADPLEPDVRLLGGFTIPDISRLTATANEISQNISVLSRRVEEAFTEEAAEDLRLAIENLQTISTTLRDFTAEQAGAFTDVTDDVRTAAREIAAAAEAGRSTLARADTLLGSGVLDTIFADVQVTAENLASISTDVSGSTDELTRTLERADSAFARIDRLTARVEAGEGLIGQLLADTALVGQTNNVLVELELLLRDLRENPKRYVRLSIF